MSTQESSELDALCELFSLNVPKSISGLPEFFTILSSVRLVHCPFLMLLLKNTFLLQKKLLSGPTRRSLCLMIYSSWWELLFLPSEKTIDIVLYLRIPGLTSLFKDFSDKMS